MFRPVISCPRPKVYRQNVMTQKFPTSHFQRVSLIKINKRYLVSHKDENDFSKMTTSPKIHDRTIRAPLPVAAVQQFTGLPADSVHKRKIIIYKPSRNAMQSGTHKTKKWRLEWEQEPKIDSPLMGWMGSRDSFACLRLDFDTLDAAVHHAESNGYPYEVREETVVPKSVDVKSYSDNFAYVPPRPSNPNWAEVEEDMARRG